MSAPMPSCIDIANSQPRVRHDLDVTVHRDRRGESWFRILRPGGPAHHRERFLRVGVAEYTLLAHCDGRRTLEQARTAAALQGEPSMLTPPQAESLLLWAQREGLLQGPHALDEATRNAQNRPTQSLTWIRLPLFRGGPWLDPLVRGFGWVFSPTAAVIAIVLWALAIAVAISDAGRLMADLQAVFTPAGWLRLAIIWLVLKTIHEAAHAISCHKFGGRVGEIGVAWMIVAPVAYVDLTDAYRIASRTARMVTSLAGVYVELTVAAVALLLWSQTSSPLAAYVLSTIAMTAGVATAVFNLNPLMRLDGYFAMTDWLDRPNLAGDAQATLRGSIAWLCLGRRPGRTSFGGSPWGLWIYAVAALLYRVTVITGLLMAGIQMYEQIGMVVAALVIVGIVARPLQQTLRTVTTAIRHRPAVLLRLALVATLAAGVGLAVRWVPYPVDSGFVAVTEFADDSPLRAGVSGFVSQIHVRDGQSVRTGDRLLQLENQTLTMQWTAARTEWQTALAHSRRHRQQHETAQAIAQQRRAAALRQRVEDLQAQIEHLTVRAPRAGRIISDQIENMRGQWISEGQAIGYVVDPECMKAIVAVSQSQLEQLPTILNQPLQVVVGDQTIAATLLSIGRQTSSSAPHPSLSAAAGGPLPTRPQGDPHSGDLLEPHLKIEVRLAHPPRLARAGQPARLVRSPAP